MIDYLQGLARAALQDAIASSVTTEITSSLLAVVTGDPDWTWLEKQCIALLAHPDVEVRGLAATCLGHIARLHGHLNAHAIEQLRSAKMDPTIAGRVEDALDDIDTFLLGEPT